MTHQMLAIPLTEEHVDLYNELGLASYREHYLHLWQDRDPFQYISNSFTQEVVFTELADPGLAHYIVFLGQQPAGIMKIVKNSPTSGYSAVEALLLEKIYLQKAVTGKGLGTQCLDFVVSYARSLGKKVLWLDTMKNGPALPFYLKYGFEIKDEKDLEFSKVLDDQKAMYILHYPLE